MILNTQAPKKKKKQNFKIRKQNLTSEEKQKKSTVITRNFNTLPQKLTATRKEIRRI